MADLLLCPFCGSRPEVLEETENLKRVVGCPNAVCPGARFVVPEDWNRRVPWLPPEDVETLRRVYNLIGTSCAPGRFC